MQSESDWAVRQLTVGSIWYIYVVYPFLAYK